MSFQIHLHIFQAKSTKDSSVMNHDFEAVPIGRAFFRCRLFGSSRMPIAKFESTYLLEELDRI